MKEFFGEGLKQRRNHMHAGPCSSFFALWEPTRKKNDKKNIGERERLSFMMLQKTKKKNDEAVEAARQQKFTWSHVFVFVLICWSQPL